MNLASLVEDKMIRNMLRSALRPIHAVNAYLKLPSSARAECRKDFMGPSNEDPGIKKAIDAGIEWFTRAQDRSTTKDGGVARHFSLITGWGPSYPETTGYIIPTMIAYSKLRGDEAARRRARRMLDWLVSIQLPDGGFQGGVVGCSTVVPVTFNTGQILLGLAAGVREFGEIYRKPMVRAADWLVKTQDPDGCWRKHHSPFVEAGEKAYDTHVAWGLLEAARLEPHKPYAQAALANVRWAISQQQENGWFDKCCLTDPLRPLTHTIGYALRGIIEAYRFTKDVTLLRGCCRTANGLLNCIKSNGFIPGRLYQDWHGAVSWSCLTGSVQIAQCWLMLYKYTGEVKYREAAYNANRYVRRTMNVDGPSETRGAIKSSFPIYGGYLSFEYPNWACKFFIDSNMLEKAIRNKEHMLSHLPFLRIFLDKNIEDSVVIHLRNNDVLPESVLPSSVDYLMVDKLHHNIKRSRNVLKPDGKLVLFDENGLSYLKIKKNIFTIFRKPRINSRLLKDCNFKYEINFTCDGQLKKLFWGEQISRKLNPSLFSEKNKLKTQLFKNKYFQAFMPHYGTVASRRPFHNYLYDDLLKEIESLSLDTTLSECFVSKTGMVIFEFQDVIVRLGVTPVGNKRTMNNANNLIEVRNYLPDDHLEKIPSVLKIGTLGKNDYCVETRIEGVDAETLIHSTESKKVMTREAASFLTEFAKDTSERIRIDKEFLKYYVEGPLERIRRLIKEPENKVILSEMEDIISKIFIGKQIPLVFSHGDYKSENMKFDNDSKALIGVFDWDLASKRSLSCFDLYNLIVSNEILIHNCSYGEAIKKKLSLFQLLEWEKRIIWDYYDRLGIPRQLERYMAFMYWVCHIDRSITFNICELQKSPRESDVRIIINLMQSFRKEILNRS